MFSHVLAQALSQGNFQSLSTHLCVNGKAWHLPFLNAKDGRPILFLIPVSPFFYFCVNNLLAYKTTGAASVRDEEQGYIIYPNLFLYNLNSLSPHVTPMMQSVLHSHLRLTAAKPKLAMLLEIQQPNPWMTE